jgi:hypothetical protein
LQASARVDPDLVEFLAPDQRHRLGIDCDPGQFGQRQAPVEADHDGAELAAAIEHFDVIGRTVGQHRHAIAGLDLPAFAHELGEAAGTFVELRIGDRRALCRSTRATFAETVRHA